MPIILVRSEILCLRTLIYYCRWGVCFSLRSESRRSQMFSRVLMKASSTSYISCIHTHTFKIPAWGWFTPSSSRSLSSFFHIGMGSKKSLMLGYIELGQGEMECYTILEKAVYFSNDLEYSWSWVGSSLGEKYCFRVLIWGLPRGYRRGSGRAPFGVYIFIDVRIPGGGRCHSYFSSYRVERF